MITFENRNFRVRFTKNEQLAHLKTVLAGKPSVCKGCGVEKEARAFALPNDKYACLELCYAECWQKYTVGKEEWLRERQEEKRLAANARSRARYVPVEKAPLVKKTPEELKEAKKRANAKMAAKRKALAYARRIEKAIGFVKAKGYRVFKDGQSI